MLQTFLPLFIMTFGICLFIVLMQFLWRYIDDMVGKGLGIPVLGEMFFYAALFLLPMALLAMKSAGVSLIHIMRPLIITIGIISIGAFFFQNNAMPVVQVKLYSLLYSMRQKSPELDIPEGVFYGEITGYNVYVKEKNNQTGLLKDVMIYDYSKGFNNARVILADSGRLKTSADKLFLVLSLFNGESFENLSEGQTGSNNRKTAVPYRRETFSTKDILIDFDANFTRTDESFMQNQYMGKQLKDLQTSIDSMTVRLDSIKAINSKNVYDMSYKKTFSKPKRELSQQAETGTGNTATANDADSLTNIGFKMARDGIWEAWEGMWLSSAILAPLGIFLTYKAVNDSVILNADTYLNAIKNFIGKRAGRKVEKKEVIIFNPDYAAMLPRLDKLAENCAEYLKSHKRWLNYFTFWKQGGKDHTAEQLATEMEGIIEELGNSDQNLVLNKLMDYPVIGGYNQLNANLNGKIGLAFGIFFPIGLPVYLLATYQRKLLRHDIQVVQKTSRELEDMIRNLEIKN